MFFVDVVVGRIRVLRARQTSNPSSKEKVEEMINGHRELLRLTDGVQTQLYLLLFFEHRFPLPSFPNSRLDTVGSNLKVVAKLVDGETHSPPLSLTHTHSFNLWLNKNYLFLELNASYKFHDQSVPLKLVIIDLIDYTHQLQSKADSFLTTCATLHYLKEVRQTCEK